LLFIIVLQSTPKIQENGQWFKRGEAPLMAVRKTQKWKEWMPGREVVQR
jgi:hypothetical protein